MQEPNLTTSTIISFGEKLEEDSSRFYEELSKRQEKNRELFLSFTRESRINKVFLTRTYQETISDAFEAGFSFKGLNLNNYKFVTDLGETAGKADTLRIAISLESTASQFYLDAAERSKSLLATIPRAFKRIAETREKRKKKLEILLRTLE